MTTAANGVEWRSERKLLGEKMLKVLTYSPCLFIDVSYKKVTLQVRNDVRDRVNKPLPINGGRNEKERRVLS